MRLLRDSIEQLTTPLFNKKGMYYAQILTKWAEIVGVERARQCQPIKLSQRQLKGATRGVLTVKVSSSSIALQLSYHGPLIKEKIAQFFGFMLVDELRVVHYPQSQQPAARDRMTETPLSGEACTRLETLTGALDPVLAAPLYALGKQIFSK